MIAGADLEAVCREATAEVWQHLGAGAIDLVVVFASTRYGANIDRLPVLLQEGLGARTLVGCSGAAVTDETQVLEGRHAIVVLAGRLPGTRIDSTHVAYAELPSPDAGPAAWRALLPEIAQRRSSMLVLGEPFHGDVRSLLTGLDFAFPGVTKVGGLASGSRHPEGLSLFCGRTTHHSGAVIVSFAGDIELTTLVASGCRPFGRSGRVTKTQDKRLLTVDNSPARAFVAEQLRSLSEADRAIAEASPLLLGLAPDPFAASEAQSDEFLVNDIRGVDQSGNLVVTESLPIGRSVRLLMRDGVAGAEELRQRLREADLGGASAALLFRCLGRDSEDHIEFARQAGDVPLAGFHCNGEIGPLANSTHLHAYSAAFGFFRRRVAR